MTGGLRLPSRGAVLFSRVRYFDPVARRAGIPPDVAALVEGMDAESLTLALVNVSQIEPRDVVVQAGGYAEHQFVDVSDGKTTTPVGDSQVSVKLAPGSAGRLKFRMKQFVNAPTMSFPWNRP